MPKLKYDTSTPLRIGTKYKASRPYPVVNNPNPKKPAEAAKQVRTVPKDQPFTVVAIETHRDKRWYKTQHGWVNEIALVGASLYYRNRIS